MALLRDENTLTSDLDLDLAATALSEIYYDNSDFEHDTINRDNIILHGDRIEYKGSLKVTDNECSSLKLKNFTLFKVHGDFVCTFCRNLESLEGAPEEVGGSFYCNNSYILSLEGGPRRVKYVYDCSVCPYLKTLDGAPEKARLLVCNFCKNLDFPIDNPYNYEIFR